MCENSRKKTGAGKMKPEKKKTLISYSCTAICGKKIIFR